MSSSLQREYQTTLTEAVCILVNKTKDRHFPTLPSFRWRHLVFTLWSEQPVLVDIVFSSPLLQVILDSRTNQAELELFPRYLLFLRQQPATRSPQSNIWVNMGMTSLRMFPPYLPPPRGNVSLQQEQSKLLIDASLPHPPLLIFPAWTDPTQTELWSRLGDWTRGSMKGKD